MIFETHAHYDDEKFDEDRAELLSSMQKNGIGRIINVSANLESLENTTLESLLAILLSDILASPLQSYHRFLMVPDFHAVLAPLLESSQSSLPYRPVPSQGASSLYNCGSYLLKSPFKYTYL